MAKKYWTQEEEQFIRDHISQFSISDFANHFVLSKAKIVDKIHKMGLNSKKSRGIIWSETDDALLAQHFEYAPKEYLMRLFPTKTWQGILQRGIKTLHLKRISQDRTFVKYDFFSEWNEHSAYFLGFILADGHLHYGSAKYLQIEISKKDQDILYKLKDCLQYEGSIMQGKKAKENDIIMGNSCKTRESVKLQINNAKIVQDLVAKGVPLDCKTYSTVFPKNVPDDMIKHVIRGLIDGDGWVSYMDKHLNIGICGTKSMCETIQKYLRPIKSNARVYQNSENCWKFQIAGSQALDKVKWLYQDANIYLDRKYNVFLQALQDYNSKILRRCGNAAGTRLETQ